MQKPELSIIIPVYNQETLIKKSLQEISTVALPSQTEILLVDDGSKDHSWDVICRIIDSATFPFHLRGIRLTKNFGQHNALWAGMYYAKGKFIVFLDLDLQDDPSSISKMLFKIKDGYDVVHGKRVYTYPSIRRWISEILYRTLTIGSKLKYTGHFGNFKIITNSVAQKILQRNFPLPLLELAVQELNVKEAVIYTLRKKSLQEHSTYSLLRVFLFLWKILLAYSNFYLFFFILLIVNLFYTRELCLFFMVYNILILMLIGYVFFQKKKMKNDKTPIFLVDEVYPRESPTGDIGY